MLPNFLDRLIIATRLEDVEALKRALNPLPLGLLRMAFETTGCRVYISPAHPESRQSFGARHRLHFGPRPDIKGESWDRFPYFCWGSELGTYIHLPADTLDPERALAVHEVGGHLVDFALSNGRYQDLPWHRSAPKLHRPLDAYAIDEYERWACAMQAYCVEGTQLPTCNRDHLRAQEPELYQYISSFLAQWR